MAKSKPRSRRSKRTLSPALKKWNAHVMKVYREGKRHDKSYMLKDAMGDASKTYKKSKSYKGSFTHKVKKFLHLSPKSPKPSSKKRRSRKSKRSH